MRPYGSSGAEGVRFWTGLVLILILVAAAIAAVLADFQTVGWLHVLLLTFVGLCYAVGFWLGKWLIIDRLEPRASTGWQRVIIWLAALMAGVLVGTEIAAQMIGLLGGDVAESRANFFPVGLALSAAAGLIDFGYERLKRRARESELRDEQSRREALRAELSALQARTDPHFLFNSLNTLAGLIEEDPPRASEMVERLAGLFRYALEGSRRTLVRLDEEVAAVRSYLEIESLRFGPRFSWRIDVKPGLESLEVPPLFLQPLVENAVIHGVCRRRGAARVEITIQRRGEAIEVVVDDDGPGPAEVSSVGSGTGLTGLRERLRLLFDERASLRTGSGRLGGFHAAVVLPVSHPERSGA